MIKSVAIVGGSLAGCRLAHLLSEKGVNVTIFDYRGPWEKPCGGGLTPKILEEFPDLIKAGLKGREHDRMEIVFPFGRRNSVLSKSPLQIVSRKDFGQLLLDKAVSSGAKFIKEKVQTITQGDNRVVVNTKSGEYFADIVVGADGVNSLVRRTFSSGYLKKDLFITYSALINEEVDMPVIIKFHKNFEGYAWVFPRNGATSVGIATNDHSVLHSRMTRYLQELVNKEWVLRGLTPPVIKPKSYLLPCLTPQTIQENKCCGDNWALIGDALGTVDPITGEGIYYALKTAHLLADAILSGDLSLYEKSCKDQLFSELGWASERAYRFYKTRNLTILSLTIDFSPLARQLTRDLITGDQDYQTLKQRVIKELPRTIAECLWYGLTFRRGARTPS